MKRYIKSAVADILREPWQTKQAIASDPNSSPRDLAYLATDSSRWTREKVAYNPNTPLDVLEQLAHDPYSGVRAWVAFNPSTPAELRNDIQERKNDYSGVAEIRIRDMSCTVNADVKKTIHNIVSKALPTPECKIISEVYVPDEDMPDCCDYYLQCGPIEEVQAMRLSERLYQRIDRIYPADTHSFEMLLK